MFLFSFCGLQILPMYDCNTQLNSFCNGLFTIGLCLETKANIAILRLCSIGGDTKIVLKYIDVQV